VKEITKMATQIRIECINKTDRFNHYERIRNVGGTNPDRTRWRLSEKDAIDGIKSGKWTFYVSVGQHNVRVLIARSQWGHEYLKTESDGEQPNNLLSLPECPN
jgi:hypothetical protein